MSFRFRPRVDVLEARDVPATFSFVLPDGTAVSGTFLVPEGVDSSVAAQVFVTPMQMTVGGWVSDVQPDTFAQFEYGEFRGLLGATSGPVQAVRLDGDTASGDSGMPVAVEYDLTDTQLSFVFSGGTPGTISYTLAAGQVDATQASQTVAPAAFRLNIAGRDFAAGGASYTTAPTLLFEYGQLKGVTFAVDTSADPGFLYSSVSMAGGFAVTAVDRFTGNLVAANAAAKPPSATIDFSGLRTDIAYTIDLSITTMQQGGFGVRINVALGSITVNAGDKVEDIRDAIDNLLARKGYKSTPIGATKLRVTGDEKLLGIDFRIAAPKDADGNTVPGGISLPTISSDNGLPTTGNSAALKLTPPPPKVPPMIPPTPPL